MKSLGLRLAVWYGAAVCVLLLLLGAFLYAALDRYLTAEALTLLRAQAAPLQRLADQEIRGPADFRRVAAQIVERPAATGVGVLILGPRGQLLVRSGLAAQQQLPLDVVQQLRGLDRGRAEGHAVVRASGQRYVLLYRPLTVGGRLIGALLLTTSLSAVDQTLRGFVTILGIGIGATLLIAGLIVVVLTRAGLRPLRIMAQKAKQIADGDLSQRVKVEEAPAEVGQLVGAFNHMAERLEESFQAQRSFVADASHELRTP
ncbi:MAG: HAMP domain-containing protein, partial [Chloroflexota bacterium]|nr:HAMP domain-containing protein [Chloroflexota bacterium]